VSAFLEIWDEGIQRAQETGEEQVLTTVVACDCGAFKLVGAARTMHPSFMASPMPKHDPKRDKS
jgi:hypothetical protein